MFELFKQGHARTGLPMVTVARGAFHFNRAAAEMIGKTKDRALLLYDAETRRVGFWFFGAGPKAKVPYPEALMRVCRRKEDDSARISCKAFLERFGLVESKGSFRLERVKDLATEVFPDNAQVDGSFYAIALGGR